MKILFFIRVNENGEIKRSDFKDIIGRMRINGDEIDIYDTATAIHFNVMEGGRLEKLSLGRLIKNWKPALFASRLIALYRFSKKNRYKYDVAQFCYIREEFLMLSMTLLKIASINIITVFGADVGQRNLIKKIFTRFIYSADIITITSSNGRDFLKKYFRYSMLEDCIVQLPLPSMILKEIAISGLTKSEAKKRLGFSKDNCIVVCGSVLSPNEQYEKWVPLLKKCVTEEEKVVFVFPFSYGNFNLLEGYQNLIKESLPSKNYTIFTGWANNEDTTMLRIATDILINLRKNDQFAGIIAESLYTKAAFITGEWLRYQYFQENEIWHYRISDFSALPEVFRNALSDISRPEIQKKLQDNANKLSDDFNYEKSMSGWDFFYDKMRQKVLDEKIK
jgi:hypothetical protein